MALLNKITPEFLHMLATGELPSRTQGDDCFAEDLIRIFKEKDAAAIFWKLVHCIGAKRAWYILEATVERWPKTLTRNEENRLHTPGGLFLQLAKKENYLCRCEQKWIFSKKKSKTSFTPCGLHYQSG